MSVESPPEWLPDGWTMEFRETRQGKHRYYKTPSGCTFRTKEEVLCYLNNVKHGRCISRTKVVSDERKQLVEVVKESPDWLPSGWVLKIKTRTSGKTAGRVYKCYFDPVSGSKFYSKNEVRRFLESGKFHKQASKGRRQFNRTSTDNVIAHIKHSPEALESPISVKEPESPRNAKKCRFTEEIMDLNGHLFPDGLLPSSSSNGSNISNITNIELKTDGKGKPEEESWSIPCTFNLIGRTATSGKMLETRCDWNSNAKLTKRLEKAKKESNSIKLQKITKKSSSKTTDMPLVSTQPQSKEPMKCPEDEGLQLQPHAKNPLELQQELPTVVQKPSTPDLATPIHMQSSRRLAGVAAVGLTPNNTSDVLKEPVSNQSPQSSSAAEEGEAKANFSTTEWPELAPTSVFGDTWPDPCIEFAFKTLTGDLPVMDEAMAIQEYFQQQLVSVERTDSRPHPEVLKLPGEQDLREMNHAGVMVKK